MLAGPPVIVWFVAWLAPGAVMAVCKRSRDYHGASDSADKPPFIAFLPPFVRFLRAGALRSPRAEEAADKFGHADDNGDDEGDIPHVLVTGGIDDLMRLRL